MSDLTPEPQERVPVVVKQDNGVPKVFHISKRERDILDAFSESGSVSIVSKELKMNRKDVKEILERPELKEYILERFRRAAAKHDFTEEKIISKLNMVLDSDGTKKFDPSFLKALDLGARIMKLIQPNSLNIGVQVNNNPYKELSDEELNQVIEERIRGSKPPLSQ